MKGSFFRDQIEYKIDIQGESWLQSSQIQGTLQVRNHGQSAWTAPSPFPVRLAVGAEKKVKAKLNDAFQEYQSLDIAGTPPVTVAAGSTSQPLTWSFRLPIEARITDTTKSLYITYGSAPLAETGSFGALQLRILPHPWIEDLCSVIETNFRFPRRKTSAGDEKTGSVEVKFDPPDAKAYSMLEQLVVDWQLVQTEQDPSPTLIECTFVFHVKEVDALQAGLKLKKTKKTIRRTLQPHEVVLKLNNRIRRDVFESVFESVLKEAAIGFA